MKPRRPIDHNRPIRWNIIGLVLGAPALTAILIWQLYGLTPKGYCMSILGVGEVAGAHAASITKYYVGCITRLLSLKDHVVIGLLIVIGVSYIAALIMALGAFIKGQGPGGFGLEIGSSNSREETDDVA